MSIISSAISSGPLEQKLIVSSAKGKHDIYFPV